MKAFLDWLMQNPRVRVLKAEAKGVFLDALPLAFGGDAEGLDLYLDQWPQYKTAVELALRDLQPLIDQHNGRSQKLSNAGAEGARKRWEKARNRKQKRADTRPRVEISVEDRQLAFRNSINEFAKANKGKYPKKMYLEFYTYWAAPSTKQPHKLGFEATSTWSLPGRLAAWYAKEKDKYDLLLSDESRGINGPKLSTTWTRGSKNS